MCLILVYLDQQNFATPTDQAHQDVCHFGISGSPELCYPQTRHNKMCVILVYLDHQNFATNIDQAQHDVCHFGISGSSELCYKHRSGTTWCVSFQYTWITRTLLHTQTRHNMMGVILVYLDYQTFATHSSGLTRWVSFRISWSSTWESDVCHFCISGSSELCYTDRLGTTVCVSFWYIWIITTLLHSQTRHNMMCVILVYLVLQNFATHTDQAQQDQCQDELQVYKHLLCV